MSNTIILSCELRYWLIRTHNLDLTLKGDTPLVWSHSLHSVCPTRYTVYTVLNSNNHLQRISVTEQQVLMITDNVVQE